MATEAGSPQKFFLIKSEHNNLVLGIKDDCLVPGIKTDVNEPETPVVTTKPRKVGENDTQLWYECEETGTIRSKMNNLCLEVINEALVINNYNADSKEQKWVIMDDLIQHKEDAKRVLEIAGAVKEPGARVCVASWADGKHQRWEIDHKSPQYFFIHSEFSDKVVDISGGEAGEGAEVITYSRGRSTCDNQLWYEDKLGLICSKLNGFTFEPNETNEICMMPVDPTSSNQGFVFLEDRIVKRTDHKVALDIKGPSKDNGSRVISFKHYGNPNQKWRKKYA